MSQLSDRLDMRVGRQLISRAERTAMGTAGTKHEPSPVNLRVKISALWASTLFIFAYVDLVSIAPTSEPTSRLERSPASPSTRPSS
jgi:hypothetical protein